MKLLTVSLAVLLLVALFGVSTAQKECSKDRDCFDDIDCTEDSCVNSRCINKPVDSLCEDDNPCTINVCNPTSGCHAQHNSEPSDSKTFQCTNVKCSADADCKDQDPCTGDYCNLGFCEHWQNALCKAIAAERNSEQGEDQSSDDEVSGDDNSGDVETDSVEPETDSIEPETDSAEPETDSIEPDTDSTEPETDSAEPNTDSAEPETDSVEPETDSAEPNTDSAEPETDSVEPETDSAEPETDSVEPNTDSAEPETDSAEPETDSVEPNTDSAEPETDSAEPNTDSAEPDTDSAEPNTDSAEPDTDSDEPSTDSDEPSTDSDEPDTPPPSTPSVTVSVSPASGTALSSFTFSASVSNAGSSLSYRFVLVADGVEVLVTGAQASSEVTVQLWKIGTFHARVYVSNASGTVITADSADTVTVTAAVIENPQQYVSDYIQNVVKDQVKNGNANAAALSIIALVNTVSGIDTSVLLSLMVQANAASTSPLTDSDLQLRASVLTAIFTNPGAVSAELVQQAAEYATNLVSGLTANLGSNKVSAEAAHELVNAIASVLKAFEPQGAQSIKRDAQSAGQALYNALLMIADAQLLNRECGDSPVESSSEGVALVTAFVKGSTLTRNSINLVDGTSFFFTSGVESDTCYQVVLFTIVANLGGSDVDTEGEMVSPIGYYTTVRVRNSAGEDVDTKYTVKVPLAVNDESSSESQRCVVRSSLSGAWVDDLTCEFVSENGETAQCNCESAGEITIYTFKPEVDCLGVVNGNAKYDVCGECDGNGLKCLDCHGNANGTAVEDECGKCGGDGSTCCHDFNSISNEFWDYILLPESLDDLIDRLRSTRDVLEYIKLKFPERNAVPAGMMDALGQLADHNREFLKECGLNEFCDDSQQFLNDLGKKPVHPELPGEEMCQS